MYFPNGMTFQYFFFDTYLGNFLQMIPIALAAAAIYLLYKRRTAAEPVGISTLLAALFPAYLAALVGLTLFYEMIGDAWYFLLYHRAPWPDGEGGYRWFTFIYDFKIDFFRSFGSENLGNILLFLPFGILYPLFNRNASWKRTLLLGAGTSLIIENIQPFMDRSFDMNDVILNIAGVGLSTLLFFALRHLLRRRKNGNASAR